MGTSTSKQVTNTQSNEFELLCCGYVRRIEPAVSSKLIPRSIYYICYEFYHGHNYLMYLSQDHTLNPNRIYMADLDTNHSSNTAKRMQCTITPLLNNTDTENDPETDDWKWDIVNAGIHYERNVVLHSELIESFTSYDIMFKCGGRVSSSVTPSNSCMAMLFHPIHRQQAYYLRLPSLPHPTCGNFVVYSRKHGLISIGGEIHNPQNGSSRITTSLCQLPFHRHVIGGGHAHNSDGWQWTENQHMRLQRAIYQPSCVTINADQVAVIAGRQGTARRDAEIYDFATHSVTALPDINTARYGAGAFYDEVSSRVYIGGGCQFGTALRHVEFFDVHKSAKWSASLPKTNMGHDYYPVIWSDLNNSLLYIASVHSNCMESIDIRTHQKSWTLVYAEKECGMALQDLFETQFVTQNIQMCRLLK